MRQIVPAVRLRAQSDERGATVKRAEAKLKALNPASSLKVEYDALVSAASHETGLLKQAFDKAKLSNISGALALVNQENSYNTTVFRPEARKLGLSACA